MAFKGYAQKELLIQVKADINKASLELQKLSKEIKKSGTASQAANKPLKNMEGNIRLLTSVVGGYLSLRLASSLIQQADAFNILQDRIRAATRDTGDYNAVSKELYNLSQQNGAALKSSVDLFQSIARAREDLGATNDQVIQLVDIVEKLGVIGGSSGASLNGAILQFSQLMGGSVVQAQEFNSIMDGMPELTSRLAKTMGLTVGQLKAAVNTGNVLSRDVFENLLSISDQVNTDFAELPDRVARASTTMSNSFDRFLSQLDQAANGTGIIARIMQGITHSLDNWSQILGESQLEELMRKRAQAMVDLQKRLNDNTNKDAPIIAGLRKEIDELDQKIKEANLLLGKGGGNKPQQDNKPKTARPDPAAQARAKAIERNIKNLEVEAATFGLSERAAARYKLQLQGATDAQLQRAAAALDSIAADKEFDAAVAASEEAVKKENAAYNDWLKTLGEEGQRVYQQTRTDSERLAAELERYDTLLAAGAIDWDTYARAVFAAQDRFDSLTEAGSSSMDELIAATRGWGDQFTNTLADAIQYGKAGFGDLAQSIINDLLRIMIYANITRPLLQRLGVIGTGGGGTGGVPGHADGGLISGPGTATSDSIPARLSDGEFVQPTKAVNYYGAAFMEQVRTLRLPKFASGGLVSFHRPAVAHFAGGGMVDGQGLPGGGSISVQIENKSSAPVKATSAKANIDANGMVVSVILEDLNRGGPIAHKLSQTYGVNRRPV